MPQFQSTHPRPPSLKTNPVPFGLQQTSTCVSETKEQVDDLEQMVDQSAENIAHVKRSLKEAHGGLERLEGNFSEAQDIKRAVWQMYQRLKCLEERLRTPRDDCGQSNGGYGSRVVQAHLAVQTPSVDGGDRQESDDGEMDEEEWQKHLARRRFYTLDNGTKTNGFHSQDPEDYPSYHSTSDETVEEDPTEKPRGVQQYAAVAVAVAMPTAAQKITSGHYVPNGARLSAITEDEPNSYAPEPKTVRFQKSPREVVRSIREEEAVSSITMNNMHEKRQGSADGWNISNAIMSGSDDWHIYVPKLECIKLHEVRALKHWLSARGHLERTGKITRIEKLLYFLILCQLGCRFESIAVAFSRTPKQVLQACIEVFEGLSDFYSESARPSNYHDKPFYYLYEHLWRILGNYPLRVDDTTGEKYYPWQYRSLCRAIIGLNMFIGRYRSHGRLSLNGEIYDWGRFVAPVQDDGLYYVAARGRHGMRHEGNIQDDSENEHVPLRRKAAVL